MRPMLLLALLSLAACASPRQNCERSALEDLRNIDALIVETEQNLARGYAYETETVRSGGFTYCLGQRTGGRHSAGVVFCDRPDYRTRDRPVAIDLKAERAKLASLKAKRPQIASLAAKTVASCRLRYPES